MEREQRLIDSTDFSVADESVLFGSADSCVRRILFLCAFVRDLIVSIVMNLLSLPDGRIINLEHLTYAERAGEYLALHFDSGAEGGMGSVVRLKQGEGARRVWAYLAGKCTGKIEPAA